MSSNFLSATEREQFAFFQPIWMERRPSANKVLRERRLMKKNAQTMIVNRAKERAHLKSLLLPPFDYTQWSGAKLLICHRRCSRKEKEREMAKRFLGSRQTNSRAPWFIARRFALSTRLIRLIRTGGVIASSSLSLFVAPRIEPPQKTTCSFLYNICIARGLREWDLTGKFISA